MTYKKNLREFSSFSWRKRRLRRALFALFNHLSSSCREDRGKIILNTTEKKAQEAMNIVCIMGISYLMQRSLTVKMIMAWEATSQVNTQHLLKGGSNCKTSPALSKQVDHFTSKGLHPNSASVQCYEYLWTHLLCSYCSSWLAKNAATQSKLQVGHTDRPQQIHIIYNFCWFRGVFFSWFILGFFKWFQDIRTCRFCPGTEDFSFYYYMYFSLTFISQIISLFYSCFYSRTTLLT